MADRWLSVDEISEDVGVIKDTFCTRISANGMPAHREGRLWKFTRVEVDSWVKSRRAGDCQDVDPGDKEGR